MKEFFKSLFYTIKNTSSMGIDGISYDKFKSMLDNELEVIDRKISNNTYEFSFYKQKLFIKEINKTREISIPTTRDKLVLKWLSLELKKTFNEELSVSPSIHEMIVDIKKNKNNFQCFIKLDIQNYFPSIDHDILYSKISQKIEDEYILALIMKAITQTTINEKLPSSKRIKNNNLVGVPQGLSISGLLADIYMYDLLIKYSNRNGIKFYKFVDDILILCSKKDRAKLVKEIQADFVELKLKMHKSNNSSTKSYYGTTDERFEFLGYKFSNQLISVRDSSIDKIYQTLNKKFSDFKYGKIDQKLLIYQLNYKITGCIINEKRYGWIQFFSMINDYALLHRLDYFVESKSKQFGIDYSKVKHFSRAIFEIKDIKSRYISGNSFRLNSKMILNIQKELEEDMEFY